MKPKKEENGLYEELKKFVISADSHNLLNGLKEKIRNIDIEKRDDFERTLYKLAGNKDVKDKRHVIYKALASLEPIWDKNAPGQNLVSQFESAYRKGNYEEAARICSKLIEQGPDYLGEVNLGKGEILPIDTEENRYVLHYTERALSFLNLDLKLIPPPVNMPDEAKIIDVLPPNKYAPVDAPDVDKKLWLLKENKKGERAIVSLDVNDKTFTGTEIRVAKNLNAANRLSRFKGHLLLVSGKSISYYKQEQGWKEWFAREGTITCTESTNVFFWVGLADGKVRVLKKLDRVGVRKRFEPHPGAINAISSSNRVVSVSSDNLTTIESIENVRISKPLQRKSRIIQTSILNSRTVVVHLSNGFLIGRNIRMRKNEWEINLKTIYDSLFTIENRIYLYKNSGMAALFSLPDIDRMVNFLRVQDIYIEERPIEKEAGAPVTYMSEFRGREDVLREIKKHEDSHFQVCGWAKTGKTSLLNILGEHLSSNSVDCYIDMEHLLEKAASYEDFEKKFIIECLSQHELKLEDLQFGTSFERFKTMIAKIKEARRYCLFCLDNFSLPKQIATDSEWAESFDEFMKDMYGFPNSRIILTCRKKEKEEVDRYFQAVQRSLPKDRKMKRTSLSLFSEDEAVDAIEKIARVNHEESGKIYRYCGRFPHLIKLYKDFNKETESIDLYSGRLAKNSYENIFAYLGELSPEARLLLATIIHKNLPAKKIRVADFYREIPVLGELIPQSMLKNILAEIPACCDGFKIQGGENEFSVNISENTTLFGEASQHIPWLNVFIELYNFRANPGSEIADEIIKNYRLAARIGLRTDELVEYWSKQEEDRCFSGLRKQYKEHFYIRKITEEGSKALGMPLTSFIVLPLESWEKKEIVQGFKDIHEALQEYVQRSVSPGEAGQAGANFNILFFEFLGAGYDSIRKEIRDIGIEGVSIIDTLKMKDIFLARDPLRKSKEEIRRQLAESDKS